jgi:hypothetical protein
LAPVIGAPGCTAAIEAYCTNPTLEVPTCTARCPHVYDDARDLLAGKGGTVGEKLQVILPTMKGSFTCRKSAT